MTSHDPELNSPTKAHTVLARSPIPTVTSSTTGRIEPVPHGVDFPASRSGKSQAMKTSLIPSILNEDLIAIDLGDAAELTLTCEHLRDWLSGTSAVVIDSLHTFGGADVQALIEILDRLTGALTRAFPSISAHLVTGSVPLCPAEALSLAELLLGIASNGWPEDLLEAEALEDDARRWALRLARTQGDSDEDPIRASLPVQPDEVDVPGRPIGPAHPR